MIAVSNTEVALETGTRLRAVVGVTAIDSLSGAVFAIPRFSVLGTNAGSVI